MTTVDSILPEIVKGIKGIKTSISARDKRVLLGLEKQISCSIFLTANQANLLVRVLTENLPAIRKVCDTIDIVLANVRWSQPFREVKRFRKIFIDSNATSRLTVAFSFSVELNEKISKLAPVVVKTQNPSGVSYTFDLEESNIFKVVDAFIDDGFEIDSAVMQYYNEIKNIKNRSCELFDIFSIDNAVMRSLVEVDAGPITPNNGLLLADRKIRYQYSISPSSEPHTLTEKIANRKSHKVYIDPTSVTFTELVSSLMSLNRFPLLVVFDGHSSEKDKNTLNSISQAVTELDIKGNIGVYFRHKTAVDTEKFNQFISSAGYNTRLGPDTAIVGISNSTLPKFVVAMGWKPKSVVTFTNSFRSNKPSVYCSDVDLVVHYTHSQPLDKTIHAIL